MQLVWRAGALAGILAGLVFGQSAGQNSSNNTPSPDSKHFEVASVREVAGLHRPEMKISHGRLTILNHTFIRCVSEAYGVPIFQIDGPEWIRTKTYSIEAQAGEDVPDATARAMLKSLLAERFALGLRREFRERLVAGMSLGKNSSKLERLHKSQTEEPYSMKSENGRTVFRNTSMEELAHILTSTGAITVDMTGLTGRFDFELDYVKDLDNDENKPRLRRINEAWREVLKREFGLEFPMKKVSLEVLVVERARQVPTEN